MKIGKMLGVRYIIMWPHNATKYVDIIDSGIVSAFKSIEYKNVIIASKGVNKRILKKILLAHEQMDRHIA